MRMKRSDTKHDLPVLAALFGVLGAFLCGAGMAYAQAAAQEAGYTPEMVEAKMRAANATTLMDGSTQIYLWGVENVQGASAAFRLKARTALDNAVGGDAVQCEVKKRRSDEIFAQCVNARSLDLGLFMLQQGFVSVDRAAVYNSVFEGPYIQAEAEAQNRGLGIWAVANEGGGVGATAFYALGILLLVAMASGFVALAAMTRHGFKKVTDAQGRGLDMMAREARLREKERGIVAVMFESELKANKAKIEAYIVVYEEMLRALRNTDKTPKYRKAGDIVQKQPALARSVFDRNTGKMDMLNADLSSRLIHLYARIKTNPDYINIEPEMALPEVIEIVEEVLRNGRTVGQLIEDLLEAFADSGLTDSAP
jgi:hypothetical protein